MDRLLAIAGSGVVGVVVGAVAAYYVAQTQTHAANACATDGTHCVRVFFDGQDKLRVDSDPLVKTGPNTTVSWYIEHTKKHGAVKFASGTGITFSFNEFACTRIDDYSYSCFDANGTITNPPSLGYKYTVSVTDNGTPAMIDPQVVNN